MSCSPFKSPSGPPSSRETSRSARSDRVIHSSPSPSEATPQIWQPPRLAKLLPYELQEHCLIYFEENLCTYESLVPDHSLTCGHRHTSIESAVDSPNIWLCIFQPTASNPCTPVFPRSDRNINSPPYTDNPRQKSRSKTGLQSRPPVSAPRPKARGTHPGPTRRSIHIRNARRQ